MLRDLNGGKLTTLGGKLTGLGGPRLFPAAAVLLALAACDRSGLPAEYRDLPVPSAVLASPEARARGRALFLEHCALCHGERADGRGPRRTLSVSAADFTDPARRERMNPRRTYYVIRKGIAGSPMPAWKILDTAQTWDLVAYVLSVAEQGPYLDRP